MPDDVDNLLLHYALAVAQMRRLQSEWLADRTDHRQRAKETSEREVDDLTQLHLTPTVLQFDTRGGLHHG